MTDEAHFPVQFGTVAIVGVGLIGGSLGMALKKRRLAQRVIGIGRSAERLEKAVALGAIDAGTTEMAEGLTEADVVVLCTTVGHIVGILQETLETVKPGAVVTDVGSTKGMIVAQAAGAPFFVGGHPMAGSEQGGVEAATPLLFEEATWAITPTEETDPKALQTIEMLAREVGATTLTLTPEAHDAMLAVTSHLPHVLASSLMRQAAALQKTHPQTQQLTAGSFADATRVAASSPELWRDVCLTNKDALLTALRDFRSEMDVLEAAVVAGDAGRIEVFFAEGGQAKRRWGAL